jgi:peptide methionine sulfoxide reductase MsrB
MNQLWSKLELLFCSSSSKFDSHCGWPAFSASVGTSVRHEKDADGHREEILCAKCDGHLGHVFEGEGLRDANGKIIQQRHCVNSASLKFEKKK